MQRGGAFQQPSLPVCCCCFSSLLNQLTYVHKSRLTSLHLLLLCIACARLAITLVFCYRYAYYGLTLSRQYSVGTILRGVLFGADVPSFNVHATVKCSLCPSCASDLPTQAQCQAWTRGSAASMRTVLRTCLIGWFCVGLCAWWARRLVAVA